MYLCSQSRRLSETGEATYGLPCSSTGDYTNNLHVRRIADLAFKLLHPFLAQSLHCMRANSHTVQYLRTLHNEKNTATANAGS